MSGKPRLLLVDDHNLVLEGFRLELQEDYEIVGMLATGGRVVEECLRLNPDLVLLDLSLPDRSGLEVIMDVRAVLPAMKVLVVTMHSDRVLADAAFQAGAMGFVPKDAEVWELRQAIREVLAGRQYVPQRILIQTARYSRAEIGFELSRLTPRQQQIVRLLGEGKSTARIAQDLHVTESTVSFHRGRIRKALGIPSEWGLMRYALVVRMSEEGVS